MIPKKTPLTTQSIITIIKTGTPSSAQSHCWPKMKKNLLILFAFIFTVPAIAHRDRLGKISKAVLTFEDGGTIVLTKNRSNILSLALQTDTGFAEVKKEDLSGIDNPQFDSIKMTWSTFSSGELAGVAYKVVGFQYGTEEKKAFGEHPEVSFHFYDGRYHHRELRVKTSPTIWRIDRPQRDNRESISKKEANQP